MTAENRRVLIIDDMESIQMDFAKILGGPATQDGLGELERSLFGNPLEDTTAPSATHFDLVFASQGLEGIAKVRDAMTQEKPFALAFVDVRMPPGLDGIETIVRLWEIDPRLEVVICTAYSDYTWKQMLERLFRTGQFLVLGKPFDGTAVRQMALALTEKWNLARAAERTSADLEEAVRAKTKELVDANAQKQAQLLERMELEKKLVHAQKLEAVGRLVAGVAHEINNPLAFVLSNLDQIEGEVRAHEQLLGEGGRELCLIAGEARTGGQRIQQIVQDLVSFSRPEQPTVDDVVVEDVMRFALRMAAPSFPPQIRVKTTFGQVPVLRTSSGMLSQVFLNLLVNSGYALRDVPADRRDLEATIEVISDGRILVKVRDTGIGIRDEVMSRIFDPFFTTRKQGEGTGLGLSICHGIIQQLGGEIRIESKEGEGTSAFVYLPVEAPPARQSPTLAA